MEQAYQYNTNLSNNRFDEDSKFFQNSFSEKERTDSLLNTAIKQSLNNSKIPSICTKNPKILSFQTKIHSAFIRKLFLLSKQFIPLSHK